MSAKKQTTERFRDNISYSLYCVNIFGSGLNTIKNEFKLQVQTGLRQTLFVLDLAEIKDELIKQPRNSKMKKDLKENFNTYLVNNIVQKIQNCRQEYELITKKIQEELKFDLYQYWLKNLEQNTKKPIDIIDKKSKIKDEKSTKAANDIKENKEQNNKISCSSRLIPQEHNTVGQSLKLSKIKYIKDEPTLGKLFILILGQMGEDFYTDLLRRDQPLEGIINFIPTESNYDIMLGNNKLRNFIEETVKSINSSINEIRQQITMKSVGLFNHNLPVISTCMATKYSREIYDQLTWSIYDIEMLKQQYEMYYYKPFQITNVEIPMAINLTELYYKAESLSIQGTFQNTLLPTSGTDLASIAGYLNSLLNTCDISEEENLLNISNYKHHSVNNQQQLFSTITKISKYDRLILEDNNKLLLNMLQYADCTNGRSIYLCCLDYNILRNFSIGPPRQLNTYPLKRNSVNIKKLLLPRYVKYYTNNDCSWQRLTELQNKYGNYQVQEISSNYKLYTFQKIYNTLNEEEGTVIIPTRLCFRDFTLFQMQEFLQDLKTPKFNSDQLSNETLNNKIVNTLELDENIFIRPNSLKALKLTKERSSGESRSRKSDLRSNRSKGEKKSSLAKSIIKTEEYWGLPPEHHLLKGYNLEDTLQEVKYKISKYYYQQGFVQLYEEKWCFQDMNKQLSLAIHNAKIFFNRPRNRLKGICNNIRLITDNNISLRILNEATECSKVIMNYPNGLSIFHHDSYCEQVWSCDKTLRNEERRIFTPFGAIIVFFKSNDLIMIMRYNGEVYRLYQHEFKEEEEEQGFASDLGDIQEKSSGYLDVKGHGDAAQSRQSLKLSSEESIKISSKTNLLSNNLKSSINYELNFLFLLCSIYELKYLHLIITTSQGNRINLTHLGEIFKGRKCSIKEWHDYFANESYCERSDGVKMIWCQDCFKCFHEDGTVFKTIIEEDITATQEVVEFESQITQSSSHNEFKEEMEEEEQKIKFKKYLIENESNLGKSSSTLKNSAYTFTEADEEFTPEDVPIFSFVCKSWLMQHSSYAIVYVLNTKLPNMPVSLEIFGIDNIRIYYHAESTNEINADYLGSEDEEYEKANLNSKLIVNVWIGDNIHVRTDKETCEIYSILNQSIIEKEMRSDSLTLRLKYTDCIIDAFKYLVNEISSLEIYNGNIKKEEIYFMEKLNKDETIRGFEFFNMLPLLSQYTNRINNNITELKTVKSIDELMYNKCVWYTEDLMKFPRFKSVEKQKHYHPEDDIPPTLSGNIFIEVPKQLRTAGNITQFLEPFEKIHFKKLRGKFKNVLNYHLKSQQLLVLKTFTSTKNWKKRHWEHERRLFNEQQRLGLYHAMNKYKTYPNYWKFTQSYQGEVRRIEFFDFMQNKCCNKRM